MVSTQFIAIKAEGAAMMARVLVLEVVAELEADVTFYNRTFRILLLSIGDLIKLY
jgi:hypothetical protein